MLANPFVHHILTNEALTRGLGDPEARILVEWLVERAERLVDECSESAARTSVEKLCLRARSIRRFVDLWCHQDAWGAACQLAAVERFTWPLPATREDPCELMQAILDWEGRQLDG
jgi:hypothetical protein